MAIKHHPSIEHLTAYAAGSLPLSQAICIAAHIELCPECRAHTQKLTQLGAHLFAGRRSAASPENPPKSNFSSTQHALESAKEKVFLAIDNPQIPSPLAKEKQPRQNTNTSEKMTTTDFVPRCLHQFVHEGYDNLKWRSVSPSIKQATLCTDGNNAQVALLKIKPGGKSGQHTHTADETTLILKGAFSDESGIFQKGDFILRNGQHKHRPIATKDSECICLTVLEGPIQFTGYFSRWLNPLLRIAHPNQNI